MPEKRRDEEGVNFIGKKKRTVTRAEMRGEGDGWPASRQGRQEQRLQCRAPRGDSAPSSCLPRACLRRLPHERTNEQRTNDCCKTDENSHPSGLRRPCLIRRGSAPSLFSAQEPPGPGRLGGRGRGRGHPRPGPRPANARLRLHAFGNSSGAVDGLPSMDQQRLAAMISCPPPPSPLPGPMKNSRLNCSRLGSRSSPPLHSIGRRL
jgi:hypothetical protein